MRRVSRSYLHFRAPAGEKVHNFAGMSSPLAFRLASPVTKVSAVVASLALAAVFAATPARSSDSAAVLLGGNSCNHSEPSPQSTQASSVRVGTFNIRAGVSVSTFAAGVKALLHAGVDIVGLQEINSKDKAQKLAQIKQSGTWDFWRQYRHNIPSHPHQGGTEQNPVLWRSDRFVCTYAGPMLASGLISLRGETPKWDDDRRHWFSVVHLVDLITGQRLSIVNIHMIPGAITGGVPLKREPRHWKVYVTEMTNLIQKVENQRGYGTVFVMGDFNAGWVADEKHRHRHLPFRSFRSVGFRSMWATQRPRDGKGTHGHALIDQVYAHRSAASARVLFALKGYSDHVPAVARYRLPAG
jgi:hypothetical protein